MYWPGIRFLFTLTLGIGIGFVLASGSLPIDAVAGGADDVLGSPSSEHLGGSFGDVSIHESGTQMELYIADLGVNRVSVSGPNGWSDTIGPTPNTGTVRFDRSGGFPAGNYTFTAKGGDLNTLQKDTVYLEPPSD